MLKTIVSRNVKEREKKFCESLPFKQELRGAFFWVETYPSSKFPRNPHCSFCVILLTNQQMDMRKNFLVEVSSLV